MSTCSDYHAEVLHPADDRRDTLFHAAAGVFPRYGFRKTSMDDLARAAGLSRQARYLHFATKEALEQYHECMPVVVQIICGGKALRVVGGPVR